MPLAAVESEIANHRESESTSVEVSLDLAPDATRDGFAFRELIDLSGRVEIVTSDHVCGDSVMPARRAGSRGRVVGILGVRRKESTDVEVDGRVCDRIVEATHVESCEAGAARKGCRRSRRRKAFRDGQWPTPLGDAVVGNEFCAEFELFVRSDPHGSHEGLIACFVDANRVVAGGEQMSLVVGGSEFEAVDAQSILRNVRANGEATLATTDFRFEAVDRKFFEVDGTSPMIGAVLATYVEGHSSRSDFEMRSVGRALMQKFFAVSVEDAKRGRGQRSVENQDARTGGQSGHIIDFRLDDPIAGRVGDQQAQRETGSEYGAESRVASADSFRGSESFERRRNSGATRRQIRDFLPQSNCLLCIRSAQSLAEP